MNYGLDCARSTRQSLNDFLYIEYFYTVELDFLLNLPLFLS